MNSEDILGQLVGFDTTSHLPNLDLVVWVEDYLTNLGIASQRVENEDGTKSNVFATIGPPVPGGVVLSGHTDVVPVADQAWDTDPFDMQYKDSRLYGRGTCDMKGFVACALAAVPKMQALNKPIHLAFSYDEEVGCRGVAPMLQEMVKTLPPIEAIIVGEPTMMQLVTGHKGIMAATTTVTGTPAHSSQTQLGASAIHAASALIQCLLDTAEKFKDSRHCDDRFTPAHTTVTVNQISGGTAVNILAEHCAFTWDTRAIDPSHVNTVIEAVEIKAAALCASNPALQSIETEIIAEAPGLIPRTDNQAEKLVQRLSGANSAGAVSFATEAGHFQTAGYDTVVFGPGDIAQAHQPNEFISSDQLKQCDAFLDKLISHLSQ
ncbi:MAG: acetylornithine deacetylase [Sphingomonadales bacterium]